MGFISKFLSKFSNGPAIQNIENFDMIIEMRDGGILLPIVSSKHLDDSQEIIDLLLTKIYNYIKIIDSREFNTKYPDKKYIQIELNCIDKPDQQILLELEKLEKKYLDQNIKFSWKK